MCRDVGEIRTARQQSRPIVVHSERDGSGGWKNAIQRLKSKVEEARERERVGDVLVIWVANSCAIRRYQRMNERKEGIRREEEGRRTGGPFLRADNNRAGKTSSVVISRKRNFICPNGTLAPF